ncbi:MAG: preprotein translocase subunit SecG [Verrucomicrobiota bacterium]
MLFVIGLLTFVMVLDCLVLVLLVLIQLPKKEAGAGVAFGGAATDALFGAGSGNVLTKTTKYAAGTFFGLAIILSILQNHYSHRTDAEFRRQMMQQSSEPALSPAPAPRPATPATNVSAPAPAGTNLLLTTLMSTNAPVSTNAAPK